MLKVKLYEDCVDIKLVCSNLCTTVSTGVTSGCTEEICLSGYCTGNTYSECYTGVTEEDCELNLVQCELLDMGVCVSGCSIQLNGGWLYSESGGLLDIDIEKGWTMDYTLIRNVEFNENSVQTNILETKCEDTLFEEPTVEDETESICLPTTGITINDVYPDNEGIIYYRGVKEENSDCKFSLDKICELDCDGNRQLPNFIEEIVPIEITGNTFDFFDTHKCCNIEPTTKITLPNCCDGIDKNNFAIILKNNGQIGYRRLELSGSCSGMTYMEDFVLTEKYSYVGAVPDGESNIQISFTPFPNNSDCKTETYGTLNFFVNGNQVFQTPFTEYSGTTDYVSIGGGVIGDICDTEPSGQTNSLILKTMCVDFPPNIIIDSFDVSGETFEINPTNVNDSEQLEEELQNILSGCTTVKVTKLCMCGKNTTRICFINSTICVDSVHCTDGMDIKTKMIKEIYLEEPQPCNILEEYFAGSFIGTIKSVKKHCQGLTYSDIQTLTYTTSTCK